MWPNSLWHCFAFCSSDHPAPTYDTCASQPRLACFTLQNATDSPQMICLFDMWALDTQTVSKSIKPQPWWQIEVTLNYDRCSEVITHQALAKMLWRSSVAISLLWRADLDPAPTPLWTTVKLSCSCGGGGALGREIILWRNKKLNDKRKTATKFGIGDIKNHRHTYYT